MNETINIVLGILDCIIFDKCEEKYIKYLTRSVDYNIEYLEPVDIIIVPRRIYVSTKKISNTHPRDCRKIVTKFCGELIEGLTLRYADQKINIRNYSFMGMAEKTDTTATLDSVSLHLMTETESSCITIDIPPNLSLEIVVKKFDPKTDINEECIHLELNN